MGDHAQRRHELRTLAQLFLAQKNLREMEEFIDDAFTLAERRELLQRWQLVQHLMEGETQRVVKEKVGISFSKVTRGSHVLQYGRGAFPRTVARLKKG